MTTIKLKNGSGAPLAGDLVQGEPALDLTNKRLYTEDSGGTVIEVGTNPSTINIDAGTIDGTVIGGTTPAAGSFTTVTADGLTVGIGDYLVLDGGSTGEVIRTPVAGTLTLESRGSVDIYGDSNNNGTSTSDVFRVLRDSTYTGGTAKVSLKVDDSGDISFYEDTGTTAKFFWDASAESLGIGASAPSGVRTKIKGLAEATNLATSATSAALFIEPFSGSTWGLGIGSISGQTQYIQGVSAAGTGSRNLAIQPYGGNVGIGTSSPAGGKLQIDVDGSLAGVRVSGITGSNQDFYAVRNGSSSIQEGSNITLQTATGTTYATTMQLGPTGETLFFNYNGSAWNETMRIDASGNVGIGTSSPDTLVQASNTSASTNYISYEIGSSGISAANKGGFAIYELGSLAASITYARDGTGHTDFNANTLVFNNVANTTEYMRITSSGNLLVGTTDTTLYNNTTGGGFHVAPSGFTEVAYESANAADPAFLVNNTGADGDIIQLRKDGSTVGSIGVDNSDNLYISGGSGHGGVEFGSNAIIPSSNGVAADATVKLGNANYRYTDLYLSGGVYLGGTGSANKLDDYEEGTWTPTATVTAGPTVGANASYGGEYTKVGNMVYCRVYLLLDDSSTAPSLNDRIAIGGLPFTPSASSIVGTSTAWLYNVFSNGHNAFFAGGIDNGPSYYIYCIHVSGTNSRYNNPIRAEFAYRTTN